MSALDHLRKAKIYIGTGKVAIIVGRGEDWVRKNKHRFGSLEQEDFTKNGKNYKFELSAVMRVAGELREEFKISQYQGA